MKTMSLDFNGVKIVVTSFACYNSDSPRFLAVLLKRLNHTHKFICVKQTDNIKHDWQETTPSNWSLLVNSHLLACVQMNLFPACLFTSKFLEGKESTRSLHKIVRSSIKHYLRRLLCPDKIPRYPHLDLMLFHCR